MKTRAIVLQNTAGGFMAHHFDGQGNPDPSIVQLFGTHILPCAYTSLADRETVLRQIRTLNPDAQVSMV